MDCRFLLQGIILTQGSNPHFSHCRLILSTREAVMSTFFGKGDVHFFGKVKVKVTQLCRTLYNPMDSPWNSPSQSTGVDSHSLLQEIFPTQGSNLGVPHCRRILYQLSHQGSPRILLQGSSWPRNLTGVSYIGSGFSTSWATRKVFFFVKPINFLINNLKEFFGRRKRQPSILAWRILWTEELSRLQSIGSQRDRHDWSDLEYI